jgi:2-polyprenyl-3-methyl-5-hydroxy-6-metoxy-1,4-benzoquinol methylase
MKREEHRLEHLDGPLPVADLAASLADLDRLNARFGGHRLSVREVARRLEPLPRDRRAVVVDVGGGRGDFALHLVAWARREGRSLRVIVVDRDATTAALARRHCAGTPEITVIQGDATALPVREATIDVAVSVLTLHHLDADGAATMLAEMRAAARDAIVVIDLPRSRVAWLAVWLTTRLMRCHPVSRHDGPLSVRRAYSVPELGVLAGKARLARWTVRRFASLLRVVLVAA